MAGGLLLISDPRIDTNSAKYKKSKENGVELVSIKVVKPDGCDTLDINNVRLRIISVNIVHDTTFVKFVNILNCCPSIIADIELKKDTINLICEIDTSKSECYCFCAFEITYGILNKTKGIKNFELNNEPILLSDKPFYDTLYTINNYYPNGLIKSTEFMRDNEKVREMKFIRNDSGRLIKKQYFISGILKQETNE